MVAFFCPPPFMRSNNRGNPALIPYDLGDVFGDFPTRQSAAFDNVTNQAVAAAASKNGLNGYIGKSFSSRISISSATVFGTNNFGFHTSNSAVTFDIRGKQGSAPTSGTNGTLIGTLSFTDTANESAGRLITSTDTATYWDYVWIYGSSETTGTLYFAEIQFTGWTS